MKLLNDGKAKIVVKRAGSQLLVANEADADGVEGEEVDLDLISACYYRLCVELVLMAL